MCGQLGVSVYTAQAFAPRRGHPALLYLSQEDSTGEKRGAQHAEERRNCRKDPSPPSGLLDFTGDERGKDRHSKIGLYSQMFGEPMPDLVQFYCLTRQRDAYQSTEGLGA